MSSYAGRLPPDSDDAYLIRQAQDGFLDAVELLLTRHSALAYRVALRIVGNDQDAQDVAQESLIAAWQGLERFRADSQFSTWLYRIVTRRALNKVTRGRASEALAELEETVSAPGDDPQVRVERDLTRDAVSDAIAALPPAQRVVLVLHHFEGLPYSEVAEVTRSSVPAVRSHLYRARRTLGVTLSAWG